nr:hypothetical protein [Armatimonas sp.]
MTLTLEKPETGARLLRFAEKRGMPLDELLDELLDGAEEEEEDDYKLTPDDIEALKRGAADIDAGRVSDAKANSAERREMILKRRLERAA